jgi:hypothetical protein
LGGFEVFLRGLAPLPGPPHKWEGETEVARVSGREKQRWRGWTNHTHQNNAKVSGREITGKPPEKRIYVRAGFLNN